MSDSHHAQAAGGRRGKKVGVIGLTVILLLLSAGLLINAVGVSKLRDAVEEGRRDGGPMTFEELVAARPKVPDGPSGADLILSLDKSLASSEAAKKVPIIGEVDMPPLGVRWSEETDQAVQVFLAKAAGDLEKLRQLRTRPLGAFPFDPTADPAGLITAELPRLAQVRHAVRLQSLQTLSRAMAGDNSQLADDVGTLFRLSEITSRDPLLVAFLTAIACDACSLEILGQSMALAPVSAEQLIELERLLNGPGAADRFAWTLRGERACFLAASDQFRSNGLSWVPGWSGWRMWDEAQGLHTYNRMIEASEASTARTSVATGLIQAGGAPATVQPTLTSLLRSFELADRAAALQRCARTAMAVERYRLAVGQPPAGLDVLVPDYLDTVPDDPFAADQPLRLAVRSNRLIIYSVGADGADGGGDVAAPGEPGQGTDVGLILLRTGFGNLPAATSLPHAGTSDNNTGE